MARVLACWRIRGEADVSAGVAGRMVYGGASILTVLTHPPPLREGPKPVPTPDTRRSRRKT